MGVEAFKDVHYFYRYLREGRFSDYEPFRKFGTVSAYRRTTPKPNRTANWKALATLYQQGRLYDVGRALREMAALHSSLGLEAEAKEALGRADRIQVDVVAMYERAVGLLARGNADEASRIWREVLLGMAGRPPGDIAQLRHHMAGRYEEAGFLELAIAEVMGANASDPAMKEVAFDLGYYHTLAGDEASARAAYTGAVSRFGMDRQAIAKLKRISDENRLADTILGTVFSREDDS